jgi:hypothetical protein
LGRLYIGWQDNLSLISVFIAAARCVQVVSRDIRRILSERARFFNMVSE